MRRSIQLSDLFLGLAVFFTCLAGCGSDNGESTSVPSNQCEFDVSGSVFGLDKGTATVSGEITLPTGIAEGLTINLMLVEEGKQARRGVVPNFNCVDGLKTRGTQFTYLIESLNAGTYQMHLKLKDENNALVYDQTADPVITVEDGAMVMHDGVFLAVD